MIGLILAAGRGSRLQKLSEQRPKGMMPVLGQPIIARVLVALTEAGMTKIVVVVAPDDTHIRPYLEVNTPATIKLTFVTQLQPRGMADALLTAKPHLDEPFMVAACDSLYPVNPHGQLLEMHLASQSPVTLTLMALPPSQITQTSSVALEGERVIKIVEKPSLTEAPSHIASLPLYAFSPKIWPYLAQVKPSPRGELELQSAIQQVIEDEGGIPYVQTEGRWDLTHPDDLLMINLRHLNQAPTLQVCPPDVVMLPPVFVESGVHLANNVRLGPTVYIEQGATIGEGAQIEQAVILKSGVVKAGEIVHNRLIW